MLVLVQWKLVQDVCHLATFRNQVYFDVSHTFFAFVPIFPICQTTSYRNQKLNYFLIWTKNYTTITDLVDLISFPFWCQLDSDSFSRDCLLWIYLAIACFDVDGGSSSSQGHTDTETVALSAAPTSSHGQTEFAATVSKFSANNFVPSLNIYMYHWHNEKKGKKTIKIIQNWKHDFSIIKQHRIKSK